MCYDAQNHEHKIQKKQLTCDPSHSVAAIRIILVFSYMLKYLPTEDIYKYCIDMNVGNSDQVMG